MHEIENGVEIIAYNDFCVHGNDSLVTNHIDRADAGFEQRVPHHPLLHFLLIACFAFAIGKPVLLETQDSSPQALYDEAGRALDAGDTALAIKLYRQLLQEVPDSVEARTNLGVALAKQGQSAEAVVEYREALKRNPQSQVTLLNLSLALYKQ